MQNKLNKTISYWSLRRKILLTMVSLLLLFGLSSVWVTRTILLTVLKAEFQRKGLNSARSLAANSIVDVLTQNTGRLKQLIMNEKNLDKDIAYVFIIDSSSRIIGHTFDKGFPTDLAKANNSKSDNPFNSQLLDTQMGVIYDIAVPVFSGKSLLAYVRLGLLQNNIQKTINTINLIFFSITFIIIIIAAILSYKVSSLITKPISKLIEAAEAIQKGDFSTRLNVKVNDEIGLLSSAFNEMAYQLKQTVEKIKHLTALEERNRIALDLHDCSAQDLANIIKRLELCGKLFKKEPSAAIKELQDLKETTRDVLNRTREVIFELKSPEDAGFDLSNKLNSYIEDYKKTTDIAVKLDIPGTINNAPPLKAKEVFYIIREALTNVKKHSQAKNVRITLKLNGNNNLMADIVDDGKGFNASDEGYYEILRRGVYSERSRRTPQDEGSGNTPTPQLFSASSGGWGIIGMRQRAASLGGELAIDSSSEKGTRVSVNIPLIK